MKTRIFVLAIICLSNLSSAEGYFEWLFGKTEDEAASKVVKASGLSFEIPTTDDKFLQLKDALDNLTPLDACYHIVVYNLKKRCGELTEEELGKLSVQLLNCQSSAEERQTYSCTDSMALADCTRDMDSTTWNSYHIVSNRARSLCYATQQHQFRRLAELTVNQLMSTAHGQLDYLKQLQEGQEQLHDLTTDTVRKLYESQNDLMSTQQALHTSQGDVLTHINDNMQQLMKEKALISAGNKELADLTENIRDKLDSTSQQLLQQEKIQIDRHKKILEDLTTIQEKSQDGLKKLDESLSFVMRNHHEMTGHYKTLYDNMLKINATVTHLLTTVQSMQNHLDERISWFSRLISIADDKLTLLMCGVYHVGYFLLAALAASFLQVPPFSRVVLLLLVTLNAGMEIRCAHSLDFTSISLFMLIVCFGNWFYIWFRRRRHKSDKTSSAPLLRLEPAPQTVIEEDDGSGEPAADLDPSATPLTPGELRQLTAVLGRLYNSLSDRGDDSETVKERGDNHRRQTDVNMPSTSSAFTPVRTEQVRPDSSTMEDVSMVRRFLLENNDDTSSISSYGRSSGIHRRTSTPQRSSSRASNSSTSSRCQGFTRTGTPCRLTTHSGSGFCHRHQPTRS